jgi:diguanylate cyclase (GGDEF)-like protein/PAS domain S-box-containing protein
MNVFALLSVLSFSLQLAMGVHVLLLNSRAAINRMFFIFCLSLSMWAFGYIVCHLAPDEARYWVGYKIASIGWCIGSATLLHFFILLTARSTIARKWWLSIILYAPGAFFFYENLKDPFVAASVIRTNLGWVETTRPLDLLGGAFFSYMVGCVTAGLILLGVWMRRSKLPLEKKQAKILMASAVCAFALMMFFETALPELGIRLPIISPIFVLVWISGIAYAVFRLGLMRITPAAAAEEILNTMSDALVITDAEGRIMTANRAALDLFDRSAQSLIGGPLGELLPGEKLLHGRSLMSKLPGGAVRDEEILFENSKGKMLTLSFSATGIKDRGGKMIGSVVVVRDITDMKLARESLNYLAFHDFLTNLPNRLLLEDRLEQALARAARYQNLVAVLFLDIDEFKNVNDTLGHEAGDLLLQASAERLAGAIRASDTVGRMGGDEFAFILPDLDEPKDAAVVTHRIMQCFSKPFEIRSNVLNVTASIGISLFPIDGRDKAELIKNADRAMYKAKDMGRNTYRFFAEALGAIDAERKRLESDLRVAVDREEFTLYYQPEIGIETRRIIGAEALIRWKHPALDMIPPMKFIPLAEETGLIAPIGEWVLRTVCRQSMQWQSEGLPAVRIAVNLSLHQFRDKTLAEKIAKILDETGLEPKYLEVEITEATATKDIEQTMQTLGRLHDMGVRIAVDDFGRALASFTYLTRLPLDTLKIGRDFVQDVTNNLNDASVIAAIVTMAHSLKLEVIIAEGIETAQQIEFCKAIRCDAVQGFFFSKPVSEEEFRKFLLDQKDPCFRFGP